MYKARVKINKGIYLMNYIVTYNFFYIFKVNKHISVILHFKSMNN